MVFFGGLGVHNFYLGKVRWGLFYVTLTFIRWGLFGWGLIITGLSAKPIDSAAAEASALAIIVLAILLLLLLWDLFAIPRQLKRMQESIKQELLNKLGRKKLC